MFFSKVVASAALVATAAATLPIKTVYQFANSFSGVGYVNIENIAVRDNGNLLLNFVTGALLVELNPKYPQPEVLVNISAAYPGAPGSLTGIAQTGKDIYTVAAGNFAFGPQVPGGVDGVTGSFSVWNVDLCGKKAKAYKVVDIPQAGFLNGVAALPNNKDIVLIADSKLGAIWKVNVKTGAYEVLVKDPLFLPVTGQNNIGINGVQIVDNLLHITNSAQGFFAVIPIDDTGKLLAPVTKAVLAPNGTFFDDFSINAAKAEVYIATHRNAVYKVSKGSAAPALLAGGGTDATLVEPTSTALDGDTLYIVTGGQGGPVPVSGGVFSVNIGTGSSTSSKEWTSREKRAMVWTA